MYAAYSKLSSDAYPPYAYTLGLSWKCGKPELAVLSLSPDDRTLLLNHVARKVAAGEFTPEESKNFAGNVRALPCRFRKVPARDIPVPFDIQGVLTSSSYSYTVGLLWKFAKPELVVMGLDHETSMQLLNGIARRLVDGKLTLQEARNYDEVYENYPARFRKVASRHVMSLFNVAASVAPSGTQFHVWQLLVPGPNGLFEGDVGVDDGFVVSQNLDLVGTSKLND